MNVQPVLEDEVIIALPLKEEDFELLYAVASDPAVWDQHPNKDRYKREVFQNFFEGAIRSHGAFIVYDKTTGKPAGSSRYYDYDPEERSILIGYTFFARQFWGKTYNYRLKKLMLDYAFQFVDKVIFHIGATNFRSQRSISKLGAKKVAEEEVTYYGEAPKLNFVYEITNKEWEEKTSTIPEK